MTLSKVSFSDILRNDYLDHFDTFGENFDFDTFKNDTFESVWVDRHPLYSILVGTKHRKIVEMQAIVQFILGTPSFFSSF